MAFCGSRSGRRSAGESPRRNTETADRYLEIFLVNSWAEHLRQHDRQTQADREQERRLRSYVAAEPEVRHLIYAYSREI
jgi:hypothetical protein